MFRHEVMGPDSSWAILNYQPEEAPNTLPALSSTEGEGPFSVQHKEGWVQTFSWYQLWVETCWLWEISAHY